MPSRTLALLIFNLYYLFLVLQCNLISLYQILTVLIKIYIEFCGKSPKFCGRLYYSYTYVGIMTFPCFLRSTLKKVKSARLPHLKKVS